MTPYDLAQRFVGLKELAGGKDNGFIVWAHSLCGLGDEQADEVPWCSSFMNAMCWILRLPRSKSAAARSWLTVGVPISLTEAKPGYDVVVLKRGNGPQPGPEILNAPGHVTLFAGLESNGTTLLGLGGNQGDAVSVGRYRVIDILGIRRCQS